MSTVQHRMFIALLCDGDWHQTSLRPRREDYLITANGRVVLPALRRDEDQ